jgi:transposase
MARGRQYSTELKTRAVRTVLDSGRPIAQVAKDLDVGSESLRTWVRQARTDAGARTGAPTSEQLEELRRLRSENRELRKANETLKAASVFFAVELDRTPRR